MINMKAGTDYPTIIAKKSGKIQIIIPSSPPGTLAAAHVVAGTMVPIRAANIFITFFFQIFLILKGLQKSINYAKRLSSENIYAKRIRFGMLRAVMIKVVFFCFLNPSERIEKLYVISSPIS
jgi:hypothetical protein